MKGIVTIIVIGLMVIALASGVFYHFVGANQPISPNASEWSNFGSYFGGVVGPIFSFLSIVLLVYTIILQSSQIKLYVDEAIKLDMLRYVSKAEEDIDNWLKTEISSSLYEAKVQLSFVVWGMVDGKHVDSKELSICLERMLQLVCSYSGALALYEDNVDPHFIYKQHYDKALDLISFLERHSDRLNSMSGPSLYLCRNQLEGQNQHS
ncbi:TPA: hypothetical protein ACPVZF_000284 [Vibrio parahaemolyticus]